MKKILNIIIILFLLFSCEEPRIEYLEIVPPGDTALSYEGGKITVSVTAFEKPTATADHTWARTAVTEFADDTYKVTVTARQNIWENERAAVITVSAGTLSDTFMVTQMAAPAGEDDEDDQDDNEDGKDEDDENQGNDPPAKTYSLKMIGNKDIIIEEGTREARLQFETDIPLDSLCLSSEAEWMEASLSEGVISLSLDANDLLEDRTSTVKLEALVKGVRALEWNVLQNPEIVTPEGMILFEDITFKKAVVRDYDTDSDRQISVAEAESIERLDVSGLGIRSLKGVEPMRNLQFLDIRDNLMADPDTSKVVMVDLSDPHPFLIDVLCDEWSAVDFSGCAALVWVTEDPATQIIELNEKSIADKSQDILGNSDVIKNRTHKPVRSVDISKDDEQIILMEHTKGPGIKIRFRIEGLIDTDIETELDERICQIIKENIFRHEPVASYIEYFDLVYEIDVDYYRENDYYPDYVEGASVTTKEEWYSDLDNVNNTINIIISDEWVRSNEAYIPTNEMYEDYFGQILSHEIIGHRFGNLKDEYCPYRGKTAKYKDVGTYPTNTIYTDDPDRIPWYWMQLMDNPSYQDKVGLYEGGEYEFGEWRSTEYARESIMCGASKDEKYNAICRFCLLWSIIFESKLHNEILPNPQFMPHDNFDYIENQEAFMQYFLEYDKRNL